MYKVFYAPIGTDTWTACATTHATGKEAAEQMEQLKAMHGERFRYKVRPIQEEGANLDAWKERERNNINSGRYVLVPWHWLDFNNELREEHFAHISLSQPGKIAYTETPEKGRQDRQTVISPGRYLQRYFSTVLSPNEIEGFAASVGVTAGACELHVTQDADEIEEIYVNGPESCMSRDADDYNGHCHPSRVYAGPDLAIAYIGSLEDPSGRAVVWPERKLYQRTYGDCSRMRLLLENAGYTRDTLNGARIRRIRDENGNGLIMPYIDGCDSAKDDGHYVILGGDGCVTVDNQCGTSQDDRRPTCEHCDERYDEDDGYYISGIEERWCDDCTTEYTTYCQHSGNRYTDSGHSFHEVLELNWCGRLTHTTVADEHLHDFDYHEDADVYASPEVTELVAALVHIAQTVFALPDPNQLALFPCEQTLADAWTAYTLETLATPILELAA